MLLELLPVLFPCLANFLTKLFVKQLNQHEGHLGGSQFYPLFKYCLLLLWQRGPEASRLFFGGFFIRGSIAYCIGVIWTRWQAGAYSLRRQDLQVMGHRDCTDGDVSAMIVVGKGFWNHKH